MEISAKAFYLTVGGIFGFIALLMYFPAVAAFILFMTVGAAILVVVFKSIKRGSITVNLKYKIAVCERRSHPLLFWFFAAIGAYIGLLGCVASVLFLFHKFRG
jgi:hypothetical protein